MSPLRTEQIYIPWMGPSLNQIWAGVHWRKRKMIADDGHRACLVAKHIKTFRRPVRLTFQPEVKGRAYDCCNYALTNKVIVDGLVMIGVLIDDTPVYVHGVETLTPRKAKHPGMWVTILECESVPA